MGEEEVSHMEVYHEVMPKARNFQFANETFVAVRTSHGIRGEHLIGWECPPTHWSKINTDGALKRDHGEASAGGLIRDSSGDWKGWICNES
ncbi:hypothetical protein Scep_027693 [Stephania cephalantha]|uniref:RNase H type-1 domain-containing protein n=1 Tax=Stephania cephalantha TaxID=152367 RepID=A0AAP0E8I2_9MAGN